jgi:NADH:ubiquinone oxidoreductase subunit
MIVNEFCGARKRIQMSFGTRLFTWLRGEFVGADEFGNKYYVDKRTKGAKRERRWVIYNGEIEASRVPPVWHAWLHGGANQPPREPQVRMAWQKPHEPNMTGTEHAYRPPGHVLMGGKRPKVSGDYEAWRPE